MSEICDKCGLPKDLCVCGEISKQQARIVVKTDRRRYGKYVTLVVGLESDQKAIMKKLKAKLACGGTLKDGVIELQGNHVARVKKTLIDLGFPEETIDAK